MELAFIAINNAGQREELQSRLSSDMETAQSGDKKIDVAPQPQEQKEVTLPLSKDAPIEGQSWREKVQPAKRSSLEMVDDILNMLNSPGESGSLPPR
jgi:hypothetical protein